MNTKHASKVIIWDWSLRIFHWLFAGSISLALGLALLAGEHSPLFEWHMLFGLSAGYLLLLRLVLFVVGTQHSHLRGLLTAIRGAPAYFRSFFGQEAAAVPGHNPLAWTVYLWMFGLLAGTVWTGINMHNEWAEDIHTVLAWLLLATIVAHLLGLLVHTVRFKETIALSMFTGKKQAPKSAALPSSRPLLGVIVLSLSLTFMGQLFGNFQPGAGKVKLPWINRTITLGEGEENEIDEHSQNTGDYWNPNNSDDEHEHDDDDD